MNVSDYIIESLANQGVKDIFLLPGGGCMYLVDALARSCKISAHPMLHEQSVGIAAESYAQLENSLGVALVTTGPGATNALTPCAAAWTDSTPVLFISGQVKTQDSREKIGVRQFGFQEIPIVEMVAPITKKAIRVTSAREIPEVLSDLLKLARSDRPGPVWLDIPLDIQSSEMFDVPLKLVAKQKNSFEADSRIIDEIVEAWNNAKRPLLFFGNGVRLSDCKDSAIQLSRKTNTPSLLSWKALDFFDEDDPLNAGRPGAIAQRWSNFAQQTADFILAIGARLDLGQTSYRPENFAPKAHKFIVDVDVHELEKTVVSNGRPICADAKSIIDLLLERLQVGKLVSRNQDWPSQIAKWKNEYPLLQEKHLAPRSGVNLYEFIEVLSSQMLPEDLLIPGSSGACSEIAMQAFKVKVGQRVLNSEGLGPMGFGIAAPIGGCLAAGKRRTISIDGDGGFLMNIQELATLKFYNLPIKIFVLNNDGYGSIKTSQDRYFEGRRLGTDRTSGLGLPNIEHVIRGFDLDYLKISNRIEMEKIIVQAFADKGPTIIEVLVDPDQVTEPRTFTEIDENGKFITSPMEKLTPLIPESELKQILSFQN